ncbi:unnamed protein product [Agarophyton chilense]
MSTSANDASHTEENTSEVQAILSDLPFSDAFSAFEPSISTTPFKKYIPEHSDTARQVCISNEKNRCLIRTLAARSYRSRKRSAPSLAQPASKRLRWIQLDKEKKQMCLKVALAASCRHGESGDALDLLKQRWAQNPRRKQSVNSNIRRAIRERVRLWNEHELKQYLLKAGESSNGMTVQQMRNAIREHLSELP